MSSIVTTATTSFESDSFVAFISSFGRVPVTSIHKTRLVLIHLRGLKLKANYVIEANVPTIILFCVVCKDVDLYKWQTFQPSTLHQRQFSHADNNISYMIFTSSPST